MICSFWFVAGSQLLYGSNVREAAEAWTSEMAKELFRVLFYPLIYNVIAKINQEIPGIMVMSPNSDVNVRAMVKAT